MKKHNWQNIALFVLSLPFSYLAVWMSADITALLKNVTYDVPFRRVALSASVLFFISLVFSQTIKNRHTSLLRVICIGLITVFTAYLTLTLIETFYWSSTLQDDVSYTFSSIFGMRLGLYLGRFIPVSLCLCLIALIISRNLILKNQNKAVYETF